MNDLPFEAMYVIIGSSLLFIKLITDFCWKLNYYWLKLQTSGSNNMKPISMDKLLIICITHVIHIAYRINNGYLNNEFCFK